MSFFEGIMVLPSLLWRYYGINFFIIIIIIFKNYLHFFVPEWYGWGKLQLLKSNLFCPAVVIISLNVFCVGPHAGEHEFVLQFWQGMLCTGTLQEPSGWWLGTAGCLWWSFFLSQKQEEILPQRRKYGLVPRVQVWGCRSNAPHTLSDSSPSLTLGRLQETLEKQGQLRAVRWLRYY